MNYYYKVIIFNIFSIFSILCDEDFYKCKKKLGRIVIIGHHYLFSSILLTGVLFQYYLFNLVLILMILFGWIIFKNRCQLSLITNEICSFNKNNNFKNFPYYFNLFFKKYIYKDASLIILNYFQIVILIFIDIIMIFNNKNQKIFNLF